MSRYAIHGHVAPWGVVTVYGEDALTPAEVFKTFTAEEAATGSSVQADQDGKVVFYVDAETYPMMSPFHLSIVEDEATPRLIANVWSSF